MAEWRDLVFEFPGTGDDRRLGREQGATPRSICILPFPYSEVLLQGETKQLRLYEDRFIRLFDDCMSNYCGVVAMGLMAESGIIQTVPLCEIEAYNRMEGFGIFATVRVVGRAKLLEIVKQEPYLKAVCAELADQVPPNMELPNLVASNIENFMLLLSSMEHRLSKAGVEKEDSRGGEDSDMQRRISIAKLVRNSSWQGSGVGASRTMMLTFLFHSQEDRFYDDADYDDDDDEEDKEPDRRSRFRTAYQVALATDTQGYRVVKQDTGDRSPQELTAISWAAFCTDILHDEDATFRIQALDCDSLFDRLKLASHMLRSKKDQLRQKMEKAGLQFRNEDMEDEDPSKN